MNELIGKRIKIKTNKWCDCRGRNYINNTGTIVDKVMVRGGVYLLCIIELDDKAMCGCYNDPRCTGNPLAEFEKKLSKKLSGSNYIVIPKSALHFGIFCILENEIENKCCPHCGKNAGIKKVQGFLFNSFYEVCKACGK